MSAWCGYCGARLVKQVTGREMVIAAVLDALAYHVNVQDEDHGWDFDDIARRVADRLSTPAESHIAAPDEREIGQLRWIRGEIARFLNAEEAIAVLDRLIAGAKP